MERQEGEGSWVGWEERGRGRERRGDKGYPQMKILATALATPFNEIAY